MEFKLIRLRGPGYCHGCRRQVCADAHPRNYRWYCQDVPVVLGIPKTHRAGPLPELCPNARLQAKKVVLAKITIRNKERRGRFVFATTTQHAWNHIIHQYESSISIHTMVNLSQRRTFTASILLHFTEFAHSPWPGEFAGVERHVTIQPRSSQGIGSLS